MVADKNRRTSGRTAVPHDDDEDAADFSDGILDFSDATEEPRYGVLFRLDGVEYDVLENPPASMMLGYFDRARRMGGNVAFSWILAQMLTTEAYQVVTTSPKISRANLEAIGEAVMKILMGNNDQGQTVPKSRTNGSRRTSG
jgi:hypothetical protein